MGICSRLINAINKIATGSKRTRILLTPIGIVFFLSICAILIITSFYADKFFGFGSILNYPFNIISGSIIIIPGIILTTLSIISFFRKRGTPLPFNPPEALITDGLYAISRNPMITGLLLQFFGLGIFTNSVTLTFIISPVLVLILAAELKFIEEPELLKRFGDEYKRYMLEVPMFLPILRRKKRLK